LAEVPKILPESQVFPPESLRILPEAQVFSPKCLQNSAKALVFSLNAYKFRRKTSVTRQESLIRYAQKSNCFGWTSLR
jgi:hypothetical protein